MNDTTRVGHTTIWVGDTPELRVFENGDQANEGSLFLGDAGETIQFAGSPERLRQFAKAIEDGAMELERLLAERDARYVSPLGDRRERSVPCRDCQQEDAWALDGLCDPCSQARGQVAS